MKIELRPDVRIYYGGDMANDDGFGTITESFGNYVTIIMDDGREIKHIGHCEFSDEYLGHGGTRFVTLAAYRKWRQKQIASMQSHSEMRVS